MYSAFRNINPPCHLPWGVDLPCQTARPGGCQLCYNLCTEPLYGTFVRNLCTEPLYGTSVRNLCTEPLYGTSVRNLCTEPLYGTSVRNLCTEPLYGTSVKTSFLTPIGSIRELQTRKYRRFARQRGPDPMGWVPGSTNKQNSKKKEENGPPISISLSLSLYIYI